MKLNLVVWREALLRLEAQLKKLKAESRRQRTPEEKFDFSALFLCKAEVTRLYCLRRAVKGQLHATGKLRRIRLRYPTQLPFSEVYPVTDLASQEELLRGVPGWMESFLV